MEKKGYAGREKRKHPRVACPPPDQPTFRTVGYECQVKDISRGGLRFAHLDKRKLAGWVSGTLALANGSRIDLEGIVVRTESKEMGLAFIVELPDDVIDSIVDNIADPDA